MKNAFAICFYFLTATISSAQSVDSLKILLANSKPDTNRVFILELLVGPYFVSNPDLAMKYAQEGLKLSEDLQFPKGQAILLWRIGGILQRTGRYPEAIERLFQSLKISEQIPLPLYTSLNQYVIAKVYMDQEDYQKANDYLFQAKKTQETIRNQFHLSVTLRTLGENYYKQNRLDSSLFFLQQSYQIGLKSITPDFQPIFDDVFKDIGQVYSKLGDNEQAMIYLKKSIPLSVNERDYSNLSEAYLEIAYLWQQSNDIDSCIMYAEKALEAAQAISYPKGALAANEFLSRAYEPIDEHKAYTFHKQAMAVKDSLFNAEKAKQVQSIEFVEQQRKQAIKAAELKLRNRLGFSFLISLIMIFLLVAILLYNNSRIKQKANLLLEKQKKEIDEQKNKVEAALEDLKATQHMLVQREKLASLGALTAGIAHEIQNPLNFVNNFSDVNKELLGEIKELVLAKKDEANRSEVTELISQLDQNLGKVSYHGKRADNIVKGMLQHSREGTGQKELSDLNELAEQQLRLGYHGFNTKDKTFNVSIITEFDKKLPKSNVVIQDIGRVFLNLFTNAFYSMYDKKKSFDGSYEPQIVVRTGKVDNKIEIQIQDNGMGINRLNLDKIFQPFFTTKPPGQGTGLGLSLSYDIIKAHGGELFVETEEGSFATFIIRLPV